MNIFAAVIRRLLSINIHISNRHELMYWRLYIDVFSLYRFNYLMMLDDRTWLLLLLLLILLVNCDLLLEISGRRICFWMVDRLDVLDLVPLVLLLLPRIDPNLVSRFLLQLLVLLLLMMELLLLLKVIIVLFLTHVRGGRDYRGFHSQFTEWRHWRWARRDYLYLSRRMMWVVEIWTALRHRRVRSRHLI